MDSAAIAEPKAQKKPDVSRSPVGAVAEPSAGARAGMPLFLKSQSNAASIDPLEREADRMAQHVTGRSSCACEHEGKRCPKCEMEALHRSPDGISRKAAAHSAGPAFGSATVRSAIAPLTGGNSLPRSQRDFFEPRFGASFKDVHIHTGRPAELAASRLNARAFTFGSNIVFGHGEYQPETDTGRNLLAHELTHVVQQSSGPSSPDRVQRSATNQSITPAYAANLSDAALQAEVSAVRQSLIDTPASSPDTFASQENLNILEAEVRRRNLLPSAGASRDLDSRLASFKQLVLTTARVRLASNRANLAIWRTVVENLRFNATTAKTMQVAQIQETVHHMGVGQWDVDRCLAETNPIRREIYCGQTEGRHRACGACHMEQQAAALDREAGSMGRAMWGSYASEVSGIPDPGIDAFMSQTQAPAGAQFFGQMTGGGSGFGSFPSPTQASATTQGSFHQAPSAAQMERINQLTATYRTIIKSLGPDGYQVWPDSFADWDNPDFESIRTDILSRIDQRQSDYLELMSQISLGKRDYLEFQPILGDLLPLTEPDVREAVQAELDAKKTHGIIEGILVGLATIALLVLTIFPPTTAIGVAGLAALEIGLGTYAAIKGAEMIDQGYAYSLAAGTQDVYSNEQIESGGGMMFMGFINLVTGPMMAYTGALRGVGAAARIGEAGTFSALNPREALAAGKTSVFGSGELAAAGPGTLRQGRLLLSYEADGTIVATVEGQPNVLMIVKDGEAVMYTRAADGTLTVTARAPLAGEGTLLNPPSSEAIDPIVAENRQAWQALAANDPAAAHIFEMGQNLEGLDTLTIIDHGAAVDRAAMSAGEIGADTVNLTGVGKVSPSELAEILAEHGWKGGHLRLVSCGTGMCGATASGAAFAEELAQALGARNLPTVVSAPKGLVQVGSEMFGTQAPVVLSPRISVGVGAFNYYGPY